MKRILLIPLLLLSLVAVAQEIRPFSKGDRVAFVGNSITDGGHYHSYIWLYYMTHFPRQRMWMTNCGVGGDTAKEILARLDDDVFRLNPTVVTLSFGMNDTGYNEYNGDNPQAFADRQVALAATRFEEIQRQLESHAPQRVIMLGTSPYDQTSRFNEDVFPTKNDAIRRIVALQEQAARTHGWEFFDFNEPMTAINERRQQTDPTFTLCGSDRIHPDNDGHMIMAYLFLKAQGMVGQKVADVQIDATEGKVLRSENCRITSLRHRDGSLSYDYLARSLPYPMDRVARGWGFKRSQSQSLEVIPTLLDELSDEHLAVSGLSGTYELRIDNTVIDTLSASQLAAGVNLAAYRHTPQYQQALLVMALNERRWEIERTYRQYAWVQYNFFLPRGMLHQNDAEAEAAFWEGGRTNGWLEAYRGMYSHWRHAEARKAEQQQMEQLVERIYRVNRPAKHRVEIRPLSR